MAKNKLNDRIEISPVEDRMALFNDSKETIYELSQHNSMIPINEESIDSHNLRTLALGVDQQLGVTRFAGYAAITLVYSSEVIELGGLVIDPSFRGRGIAGKLTRNIIARAGEMWPNAEIIAFANEKSGRVFNRLGAHRIEDPENELMPEVWKTCSLCTGFKEYVTEMGERCCRRVYDLSEIGEDR